METTDAFAGLACRECSTSFDPEEVTGRCPKCGGILDPQYDLDTVEFDPEDLKGDSMWRFDAVLPFPREVAVTMGEGDVPLVDCPTLADGYGVGDLLVLDEGQNPTGTFKDRGQSVAVTAAAQASVTDVALASAGNAGQAAAAYAARAGLDAHVFLPSRAGFTQKAMVNVYGGDLTVVGGRIGDAGAAFKQAREEHDWYPLQTFVTPYRHDGKKTMYYDVAAKLGWEAPDAVVYPTGGGVGLIGMYKAALELRELGIVEEIPRFYAAQATGCAPIVDAFEGGSDRHDPVEHPDTICGGIEIPDPGASPWILESLRETEGGAVATEDEEILAAAVEAAQQEGLAVGATAGAAVSGTRALAEAGEFDEDDTVVVVNTGTGNKDADVLRSHLIGQGV